MVRVQALILNQLRSEMPKMTGKDRKQRELIAGLEEVFLRVMKGHNIPVGDFPDVNKFRNTLSTHEACRDFTKFKKLDDKLLAQLDAIIAKDVGDLMNRFDSIPSGGLSDAHDASVTASAPRMPAVTPTLTNAAAPKLPAAAPVDPWADVKQALPAPSDPWASSAPAPPAALSSDPWANAAGAPSRPPPSDPWASAPPAAPTVSQPANVVDGLFGRPASTTSPFGEPAQPAQGTSLAEVPWAVSEADKAKYDSIFAQMQPEAGKVSGAKVAPVLKRSGLQNTTLHSIWSLVDVNKDGFLDDDWFAVAMHLTMRTKRGDPLPKTLPLDCVPPSAR